MQALLQQLDIGLIPDVAQDPTGSLVKSLLGRVRQNLMQGVLRAVFL